MRRAHFEVLPCVAVNLLKIIHLTMGVSALNPTILFHVEFAHTSFRLQMVTEHTTYELVGYPAPGKIGSVLLLWTVQLQWWEVPSHCK